MHLPQSNATRPAHYSPELQCPNAYSAYNQPNATCDARHPDTLWNPAGNGLLHVSFPFPIYFMRDAAELQSVVDCYDKWNAPQPAEQRSRSLCSVQINQFMSAAGNSEVCMRRSRYEKNVKPTQYCDSLGGSNLFATLFARAEVQRRRRSRRTTTTTTAAEPQPDATSGASAAETAATPTEQFIVVSARMDSTGMFDGVAPGAMEALPLVVALTTAHTLARLLPERLAPTQPNVLFVLFNGESYDYIGSQRFVHDVRAGRFPPAYQRRASIRPEQIRLVVDVAGVDDPGALLAYQVREFAAGAQLVSALEKYSRAFGLGVSVEQRVQADQPPSAVQSFLRDGAEANVSWPTVALRSPPANRYLHSLYDDVENVGFRYANTSRDCERLEAAELRDAAFAAQSVQMGVRNVSTALALALYELVTGRPVAAPRGASAVLVDELLHCYLEATQCRLHRAAVPAPRSGATGGGGGADRPPNRYISVGGAYAQETMAMTYDLLAWLIGARVNRTEAECGRLPWHWMAGLNGTGECRLGRHNLSEAESPAWTVEGEYSANFSVNSVCGLRVII